MAKTVTAIVPALNEEARVGHVLDALTTSPDIDRVIVVVDGSTDATGSVVKKYRVTLLSNSRNLGKAESVKRALNYVDSDIVLTCDADLIGLKHSHIHNLIMPVRNNENVMTVAVLDKYWHFGSKWMKDNLMLILINGTRALATRHLRQACKSELFSKYGIEPVINFYCHENGVKVRKVNLKGVKDVMKMRKRNHGWIPHIKETINVSSVYMKLYSEKLNKKAHRLLMDEKHE